MGSTFFGLTPNHRQLIFKEIHDIVYFGKGGFTWETVYNMPIWLRRFTSKSIEEQITAEHEIRQKSEREAAGVEEATPQNSPTVEIPEAIRKATYNTTVTKKQ